MEIRWQVEDGYVGHGSYTFDLSDEEILDCGTVRDAMGMIENYAQQEFENNVSWCFLNHDEFRAEVEKLFENKPKE